jgi:hypothetical protein
LNQAANRHASRDAVRLSYKFQRLRERLRQAIATGELSGKLPGERQLARKYRVNAKTLSKALTDLAAEGLLDRSIGRGTFVRGDQAPVASTPNRWLILCDSEQLSNPLVRLLTQNHPSAQVVTETASLRPSFLNTFTAVIDLAGNASHAFLRDLVVRGMNVVLVGREADTYAMHSILIDAPHAAAHLTRDLMLGGHMHVLAVTTGGSLVADAIRRTIQRYNRDAAMDVVTAEEVPTGIAMGATAIICDSVASADRVRRALEQASIAVPEQVSLCAMGTLIGHAPCDGYFVDPEQELQAIEQVLGHSTPRRPTTLWLTARQYRVGTTAPRTSVMHQARSPGRPAELSA